MAERKNSRTPASKDPRVCGIRLESRLMLSPSNWTLHRSIWARELLLAQCLQRERRFMDPVP